MEPYGFSKTEKRLETFGVIISLVLAFLGIVIGASINNSNRESIYEMSEDSTGYFYDGEATPELKDDGITAVVNEMYYTKGGHLYVFMTFGNGTDERICLEELDIEILDGDTGELIAAGYTAVIDYELPAGGMDTYIYYIDPENVYVSDAALENVHYEITAVGTNSSEYE